MANFSIKISDDLLLIGDNFLGLSNVLVFKTIFLELSLNRRKHF